MSVFLRLFRPLSLSLLFLLPTTVLAQECDRMLYGAIKDKVTGAILPGASLKLKETGQTITADNDGHYHFGALCSGRYTLVASFTGYRKDSVSVVLSRSRDLVFSLLPDVKQLSNVSIVGTRVGEKPLQSEAKLAGKALDLSRGESLAEALKRIPGMSTIQTGPSISKPVIHGLHSNRVLIYNAGVRQEGQQWGSEHAPEIDPFIASQITVVKGAASVMYGADALGGVILVDPAPLNYRPGTGGRINLVGMSNNGLGALSAMLEGSPTHNPGFSWRLQGTLKIAGNSKTPDYYLRNTGFNEANGSLQVGYRNAGFNADLYASTFNSKLGIFTGSHNGSTTDLLNAIARREPLESNQSTLNYDIDRPYQLIRHQVIKLRSGYQVGNLGKLNLQYSFQRNNREEYDLVRKSNEGNYQLKFDLTTQALDFYLDHRPFLGLTGRVGVSNLFQQNFYDGRYLVPFFDSYNGGLFLIEKKSWQRWELEAGLRYDYKWMRARLRENVFDSNSPEIRPEFSFNQVSGTFGSAYQLGKGYRLNATLAKAWRPPAINELFSNGVHHGSATFEKGNRDLLEESSVGLNAGLSRQTGRLTGDVSLYYNRINRYIYLKPSLAPVLTIRGAFPAFEYVQVDARFSGADILAAWQFSDRLSLTGKYARVRAFNTATHKHLEFIPADRISGIVGIGLPETKKLKNSALDVTVQYSAKQSRITPDQDFAPVPAAYTLVHADLSGSLALGNHRWNVSLSAQNLLNARYRDYLNRFRYYADDVGRNIVFRVQIPFGKNNTLIDNK